MRNRGFTLIELLIVVTIMATLMTIMFRLGAISADESKKITTVTRMQKLENCLSGYYSAFGSYPPVAVYGSRDIYMEVENGVQTDNRNGNLEWSQIQAACRSQPVDAAFPFEECMREQVEDLSKRIQEIAQKNEKFRKSPNYQAFSEGFSIGTVGSFLSYWDETDWRSVQLFKFGLLSYLLPRYLVMMRADEAYYGGNGDPCGQWKKNNDNCVDSKTGVSLSWHDTYNYVQRNADNESNAGKVKGSNSDYVRVANMSSQAVCANWLVNFHKLCNSAHGTLPVFGVEIADGDGIFGQFNENDEEADPPTFNIYSPGGKGGNWYLLDTITVRDGWEQDFYYYAPLGAQSYVLWSSGKNTYTFPPWADRTGLMDQTVNGATYEGKKLTVGECIADDIIRMNH